LSRSRLCAGRARRGGNRARGRGSRRTTASPHRVAFALGPREHQASRMTRKAIWKSEGSQATDDQPLALVTRKERLRKDAGRSLLRPLSRARVRRLPPKGCRSRASRDVSPRLSSPPPLDSFGQSRRFSRPWSRGFSQISTFRECHLPRPLEHSGGFASFVPRRKRNTR